MKKYEVVVPFCGYVSMTISAESEEEAISIALSEPSISIDFTEWGDVKYEPELIEWDFHKEIVRGNVFYGGLNRAEATEIEDEEE